MTPFIIVGMRETGSDLLVAGLSQHPHITAHGELFHAVDAERSGAHAILRAGEKRFFGRDEDAIEFLREEVFGVAGQNAQAVGVTILAEHLVSPGTERLFTRLKETFPELKVVHVARENYLDALVSREFAKHNANLVASTDESSGSDAPPRISVTPEQARRLFERMWQVDDSLDGFSPDQITCAFGMTICVVTTQQR